MPKSELKTLVKDCVSEVDTIVRGDQTIEEAIAILRKKHISANILYFYVLENDDTLIGIISARDLILKESQVHIRDAMVTNVVSLLETHTLEEGMEIMQAQRLLALPVVDENRRFLGVINVSHYIEESMDVANSKQRLQIFQMLGFFVDEGRKMSTLSNYKIRMPWIFCNMIGGVACAIIAAFYEDVLSKVIILAMFIPLVLSLSESISMQAMTQSLNAPPSHDFLRRNLFKSIFSQWKLFVMLSVTCGLIIGGLSIFWGDGLGPSIVIAVSIMISITITALIGSAIPTILHYKRLDPKVASGPLVLSLADIITTLIYLSLATWLLL
ncbi:MAG: CBS domain-containing protein [Simkaniaceae bacterium]|nr:CBS domain-containing protein [Simkaniaceae bacterium]